MYGYESWTIKKAERQRIDAFELWCGRRLESPLDCKEIQPVHCEGDQPWDYFGRNDAKTESPVLWPPHAKSWLIEKTLMLKTGGEGDDRGWDGWMASPTRWTWVWVNSGSWWWTGRGRKESDTTERLNWTELNWITGFILSKYIGDYLNIWFLNIYCIMLSYSGFIYILYSSI